MQLSYDYLLNIKYKRFGLIFIIILLLIILLILGFNIKTYNTYQIYGVYQNNYLAVNVPIIDSDAVLNGLYLKVNNDKYDYKIDRISSLEYYDNVNYQTYYLNLTNNYQENEILKITFYYKKQRIIRKIFELIF